MARERERDRAEERRFRLERQRWAFRAGLAVLAVVCAMYFIAQPILSAFGHPINLPDGRVVFVIVVMAASAVWSFDPKDIFNALSGINISFGKRSEPNPPGGKPSGDGDDDA